MIVEPNRVCQNIDPGYDDSKYPLMENNLEHDRQPEIDINYQF